MFVVLTQVNSMQFIHKYFTILVQEVIFLMSESDVYGHGILTFEVLPRSVTVNYTIEKTKLSYSNILRTQHVIY